MNIVRRVLVTVLLLHKLQQGVGLNVVLAGGSGSLGKGLAVALGPRHKVTILSRNAYLASAPNRVTEVFGWVGESFLKKNPQVKIRDWDGGDLLDIVGQDWVGWQQDTLADADVVVNLVGGYTQQRNMATERIVRESFSVNPDALQVTVSPTDDDLALISPGEPTMKKKRIEECEEMVSANCENHVCLRFEANRLEENCQKLKKIIEEFSSE